MSSIFWEKSSQKSFSCISEKMSQIFWKNLCHFFLKIISELQEKPLHSFRRNLLQNMKKQGTISTFLKKKSFQFSKLNLSRIPDETYFGSQTESHQDFWRNLSHILRNISSRFRTLTLENFWRNPSGILGENFPKFQKQSLEYLEKSLRISERILSSICEKASPKFQIESFGDFRRKCCKNLSPVF